MAAYGAALEFRTRLDHPVEWAATQTDLGRAWERLPGSDRAEGLGKRIEAYRAALKVYGRKTHPADCAAAHCQLGTVLVSRAKSTGSCRDPKAAVAELRAEAEVWIESAFPYYRQRHIDSGLERIQSSRTARGCSTRGEFDAVSAAR